MTGLISQHTLAPYVEKAILTWILKKVPKLFKGRMRRYCFSPPDKTYFEFQKSPSVSTEVRAVDSGVPTG